MFDFLEKDENYFAKREGLKTLHEVLEKYQSIRLKYVQEKEHLKSVMQMLLDKNKGIQYEAFLLLSFFVQAPDKTDSVKSILHKNAANLIDFIDKFQKERDDEDFLHMKASMIDSLKELR